MRTEAEIKNRIKALRLKKANLKPRGIFDHIAALKETFEIDGEIKGLLFALEESKEKQLITIHI